MVAPGSWRGHPDAVVEETSPMPLKVETIAPFVTAAADVVRAETGMPVRRGKLWMEDGGIKVNGVAALISLLGQIEGLVMFNMATTTCLAFVSSMMGEDQTELDEMAQSGIAELCNVIAGRAATKLSNAGLFTDISVPSLIIGKDVTISILRLSRLVVPLETELGTLEVHLAIKEK